MGAREVTPRRGPSRASVWLAILAAFGVRVYALAAQSLWNDEGTSVALATRSLEAIINGAAHDIHPPLYYFLLHFWMTLAGESEFAVRFLSVTAGLLVVAAVYRIGRVCLNERVGAGAAFLAALSPFLVYYSQETRMYIWVTLWAAVSALAFARILGEVGRGRSRAAWVVYGAATLATLYTHYFGITLVLFENAAVALWLVLPSRARPGERGRILVTWLAVQALVGLAYLPWYLFAGGQLSTWPAISEPFDVATLLGRTLVAFSAGRSLDGAAAAAVSVGLGLAFLIGLIPQQEGGETAAAPRAGIGTGVMLLWAAVPVGAMYVISLSRPAYDPKLLLLSAPPFLLLAARGLDRVLSAAAAFFHRPAFGRMEWGMALLALALAIPGLRGYYDDPRFARDDYRALVRSIDKSERAGDGILVDAPGQIDVVRYYHRGGQPFFLLPRMRPPDPAATRADVDRMLEQVQRVYAIYWATDQSDPQRVVESRLAEKGYKASDTWFGNVRLAVYGAGGPSERGRQNVGVRFGDEITLVSVALDPAAAHAGDVVGLTLEWRADKVPTDRYKVFVHLLDAQGKVAAQRDGEPVGDLRPTTTWRAGESVIDRYGVLVEPGTPPGTYRLEIGMYRADNGARLPVRGDAGSAAGDHLILASVTILD